MKVFVDRMKDRPNSSLAQIDMTNEMREWIFGDSFTKICLRVESEKELDNIFEQAKNAGIVSSLIIDSGRTMFNGVLTKTCCAIGPDRSNKIDPITRGLKLL